MKFTLKQPAASLPWPTILLVVAVAIGSWVGGAKLGLPNLAWLPSIGVFGPTAGPRQVLIVREALDVTQAQSTMETDLRTGAADKYLAEKKHTLSILDDEEAMKAYAPYKQAGELLIIAPPDKLLYRGDVPATADAVLAKLKEHGG